MHLKFLPHGKGSARAAVKYLVGERDAAGQEREGVEVLRGNPDMVAAVADSVSRKIISDCYDITYTNVDQTITSLHPSYRTGIQSTPSEVLGPRGDGSRKLRRPPIQWNHEQRRPRPRASGAPYRPAGCRSSRHTSTWSKSMSSWRTVAR